METLTKLALGLIGQLRPDLPVAPGAPTIGLPAARFTGGMPLLDAVRRRRSRREFSPRALPAQALSDLLWAAGGVNRRRNGGRTAPSAMDAQEVALYFALPGGLYLYDPAAHLLRQTVARDVQPLSGYQDFVDTAPLDLIYVADAARARLVPADRREAYAFAAAGAMAQNVYLYCAATGLATVIRGWFDAPALAAAMALRRGQKVRLAQTVGRPARARAAPARARPA